MPGPQIVITMAGFSRRFRDAGYHVPKYRLLAHDRSLFFWSLSSLASFISAGSPVVFVARRDDISRAFIETEVSQLHLKDWALVEIDQPTDGQATTALHARPALEPDSPILIYNIDTYVEPWALPATALHGDGWVPCFPGQGDSWSFAKTAEGSLRVVEMREKKRISSHASIGLYGFTSFSRYEALYASFYNGDAKLEGGERYIAPMYNQLIAEGGSVYAHPVPLEAMHPLGTPVEYQAFCAAPCPAPALAPRMESPR